MSKRGGEGGHLCRLDDIADGGSARFVAQAFMGANLDNRALKGVYIGVVMGRHAGFLAASSCLARKYTDDGPHLIYLPERPFDPDTVLGDIDKVYTRYGRCVIALSEGVCDASGTPIVQRLKPEMGADDHGNVQLSGTGVLGETPEIYGAEHLLTRRAVNDDVAGRLIERIKWWEDYVALHDGAMNNNPSPGNKAGGLTTILEKSLGAAAKGGTTNLVEVYRYAEAVTAKGFVFMDTPGYDPVSVTGMVAGGANMVCFTTGRGSVFGCKPVPCIKLATNPTMYERMADDMDINCGPVVDGGATIADMGEHIFQTVLDIASGTPSKSEALGFGDDEFVPWQIGAVM